MVDLLLPDWVGSGPPPAVLWVHGSGWHSGNRRAAIEMGHVLPIVETGFVLASCDTGFSAGAHLAALAALRASVPELEGESGSSGLDTGVSAAVVLAQPTDFLSNPGAVDRASVQIGTHLEETVEELLLGGPLLEGAEVPTPGESVRICLGYFPAHANRPRAGG
jgi:acetyl esterase/lipase